jgi:small subunit ribosomal protein S18
MPRYTKFYSQVKVGTKMANGKIYVDYKSTDELRRLLTANGKLSSRQRTKLSSMLQRHSATAVKRARYMALLPYEGDNR